MGLLQLHPIGVESVKAFANIHVMLELPLDSIKYRMEYAEPLEEDGLVRLRAISSLQHTTAMQHSQSDEIILSDLFVCPRSAVSSSKVMGSARGNTNWKSNIPSLSIE